MECSDPDELLVLIGKTFAIHDYRENIRSAILIDFYLGNLLFAKVRACVQHVLASVRECGVRARARVRTCGVSHRARGVYQWSHPNTHAHAHACTPVHAHVLAEAVILFSDASIPVQ